MDYDELKLKTRQGDIDAATELLRLARARPDTQTVLLCWSVAHPVRFRAWKAFDISMRAADWLAGTRGEGSHRSITLGINTTERIRTDIIANALLAACRTAERTPFIKRLNEMSAQILEYRGQVDPKLAEQHLAGLKRGIEALLLSEESELDAALDDVERRVAQILKL